MQLRWIIASLSLGLFYLLIHPAWYGDAVWYANSLENGEWLNFDFGHLIWRPAGFVLWQFILIPFAACDPLVALQLLSALFSGGIPILTYLLCKKFDFSDNAAIKSSLLLLFSHFLIAYGASGSSYTPALFFSTAAMLTAFSANVLLTSIFAAVAFSFWALAALSFPAIATIIWLSSRSFKQAVKVAFLISLLCCLMLLIIYSASSYSTDLISSVKDSGHGIPIRPTVTGTIRAILGVDGASWWQRMKLVILPNMKASIMVAVLFRAMDAFRIFDSIYIMTNGAYGTEVLSLLAYRTSIGRLEIGMGSAVSVILFLCVALMAVIAVKGFKVDLADRGGSK